MTGVVLAVNGRVLAKNCTPFDRFLSDYPSCQLLVWTATGEPPISRWVLSRVQRHFEKSGTSERVGYDCEVAPSFIMGLWYDSLVGISAVYFHTVKRALEWAKQERGMITR